jgi:tetratricopeptide (TPR) repeat protein
MSDVEGLDHLRLGRKLALQQQYSGALQSFQRALQLLAFDGNLAVQPQYLSHYGASLAGAAGRTQEGRRFCERSIQLEPYEPEHYLNLGLVHAMAGRRREALGAFARGLSICPDHPRLQAEIGRMERRRFVPFPALPREHLLNRCLGKLLSAAGIGLNPGPSPPPSRPDDHPL